MSTRKDIPMRVVQEETGLTSRQIRYYDQKGLVFPERTSGNQRLFSREDIKRLKMIKTLLEEGYTIEAIKKKLEVKKDNNGKRIRFDYELLENRANIGDLSRFPEIRKIKNSGCKKGRDII